MDPSVVAMILPTSSLSGASIEGIGIGATVDTVEGRWKSPIFFNSPRSQVNTVKVTSFVFNRENFNILHVIVFGKVHCRSLCCEKITRMKRM